MTTWSWENCVGSVAQEYVTVNAPTQKHAVGTLPSRCCDLEHYSILFPPGTFHSSFSTISCRWIHWIWWHNDWSQKDSIYGSFQLIPKSITVNQGSHRSGKSGNSGKILKTFSSQGNQGKTRGFQPKSGKKFQIRELFSKPFSNLLIWCKMFFKNVKPFF